MDEQNHLAAKLLLLSPCSILHRNGFHFSDIYDEMTPIFTPEQGKKYKRNAVKQNNIVERVNDLETNELKKIMMARRQRNLNIRGW